MISATHPKPDVPWPLKFQAQTWANCNNITVMVHAKVFGLNHLNQSFLCWGSHSCSTGSKERMFHDGCVCVSVCLCLCLCVCVGKHRKIMINRTRLGCPIFKQTHADRKWERAMEQFLKTPPPIPWSPPPQRQEGLSNTRSPFKWCFHRLSVSFLLSFSEALTSHLDQRIYIVFSLWDVSLQPPDLHVFLTKSRFCKVGMMPWHVQGIQCLCRDRHGI